MRMLSFLLIVMVTICSAVACKLDLENENGGCDHEHSSNNSTYKDYNQDETVVRSVVPQIFNNPNQACYTQFFVGGVPPVGLRAGRNLQNIKYICQRVNGQTYYGTMFDENRGIAVFSAYTVTQTNVNFRSRLRRPSWKTQGMTREGSDEIYQRQRFHKGHLVPGATYSNTADSFRSTFVYTNAVPQRPSFNGGQWCTYEKRIRAYAQQCVTQGQGTLYLLTGTGFSHIQSNRQRNPAAVPINLLGPARNKPAIVIPNSMWTAGCCVYPNRNVESFAVIGNNLQNNNQMLTQQIKVTELQSFLASDVGRSNLNIGGATVNLFPAGNGACSGRNLNSLPPPSRGR